MSSPRVIRSYSEGAGRESVNESELLDCCHSKPIMEHELEPFEAPSRSVSFRRNFSLISGRHMASGVDAPLTSFRYESLQSVENPGLLEYAGRTLEGHSCVSKLLQRKIWCRFASRRNWQGKNWCLSMPQSMPL